MFVAMPQRDLFDYAWSRTRYVHRRSSGFSPNVDVYYCGEPQRAIVKVDLAGVSLERGRDRGRRPPPGDRRRAAGAGDRGPRLPADRDPLRAASAGSSSSRSRSKPTAPAPPTKTACCGSSCRCATPTRPPAGSRSAASDGGRAGPRGRRRRRSTPRTRSAPISRCRRRCPVLPLRDSVAFPESLNPLAVGQERSIQLVNDVLGTNRMLVMVASRDPENEEPGPGRPLRRRRRRRRRADDEGPRRHACASSSRGPSGSASASTSPSGPTWSPRSPRCPTSASPAPSWRR